MEDTRSSMLPTRNLLPKRHLRSANEGDTGCGCQTAAAAPSSDAQGKEIAFSLVMATYNRRDSIGEAIDSVLAQTYRHFELIIVDDGSTDGTEDFLRSRYAQEFKLGHLRYFWKENGGICSARNAGLKLVRNDWIGYVDSDNALFPSYLETFARAIRANPERRFFYAKIIFKHQGRIIGRPFDYDALLERNFIDSGALVHHRSLMAEAGTFDEAMTRLVDWELSLRYAQKAPPFFINRVLLLYSDDTSSSRISTHANYYSNLAYLRRKHCHYPVVTTIITTYNHASYIEKAILSAIRQKGRFIHEILISDDASTDGTRERVRAFAQEYPYLIRDISSDVRLGISGNMQKCFQAATGEYLAVLEGDDYWSSPHKLAKQIDFLARNPDCSMVFSRVERLRKGKKTLVPEQDALPQKMSGRDFFNAKTISLIINFSCCLFRKDLLLALPQKLCENRLSEIALAFYLERFGLIGFIQEPLSVYRMHGQGTWAGADRLHKLRQKRLCREAAMAVCLPEYQPDFVAEIARIDRQIAKLQAPPRKTVRRRPAAWFRWATLRKYWSRVGRRLAAELRNLVRAHR